MVILHDLLSFFGLREIFPDQLGLGSLIIFLMLVAVLSVLGYILLFRIHEFLFYKEEKTRLEEVQGRVRAKKIEHRKSLFHRGKVKEIKILVIRTRKMGDILVEDKEVYERFSRKDLVVVLFQKKYLVRRFKKDAKYLGIHIVDVILRS